MPKRVKRNDQDYIRFRPYRAIVAPPINPQKSARKQLLHATVAVFLLALLVASGLFLLHLYRPLF